MKKALIIGIAGQDGSHLADWLLAQEYEVHGIVRRATTGSFERIAHLRNRIQLHQADLFDQFSIHDILRKVRPAEVYNLGAMSFVPTSWQHPVLVGESTALGVARVLEAIRLVDPDGIRFYQASSSEVFGRALETPQRETTPFNPQSPYAVAKAYGHWVTVNYRESYGMFCCSGILFNHEGPRRSREFVTRKVTDAAARIKLGVQKDLQLGNMEARRDWGYAPDYVRAMWLMLQQDRPEDFVIATGESHSVRELVETAFRYVDLDWRKYVIQDPALMRPVDVHHLIGDASKARRVLGWKPEVGFTDLIRIMVEADSDRLRLATIPTFSFEANLANSVH
jgi:GDPmannose 4,6-dehydratase